MSRRKPRKPLPETKTVTIKDVPGEIAEIFNVLIELNSEEWVKSGQTKAEAFSEIVRDIYIEQFGKDAFDDQLHCYRANKKRREEIYERYMASQSDEHQPK